MLTKEQNETFGRVGPGTIMGNLFRQYWLPAFMTTELAEPDGAPLRLRLLSEDLVAWRNTDGSIGVMQNACPHRGASMFFGRNEENGLRCVYHGWKFDTEGVCTDMPNEPAESNFKHKIKAVAYPTAERNGVIWIYMGPRQTPPELPHFEPNMNPDGINVQCIQRECNWLQALEGDIDTSHLGFLHLGSVKPEDTKPGTFDYYTVKDRCPQYSVVDTDYGTMYAAWRPAEPDTDYWRIANFLFPCWTMIPTGVLGLRVGVRGWVPLDDSHTMYWSISTGLTRAGITGGARTQQGGAFADADSYYLPTTSDGLGRWRTSANASNDYQIDRDAQKHRSYTGIAGIFNQDHAVTESMGWLMDRTNEKLGSADLMIIRTRRRLLEAARLLADQGTTPPGVENPEVFAVRSGSVFLPKNTPDWLEATAHLRKAFVEHAELRAQADAGRF